MSEISVIVEGDGEEQAAPLLIRRLLQEKYQEYTITISAINAKGNQNLERYLERFLELTRRKPSCVGVIVLLDLETDRYQKNICPGDFAISLAKRIEKLNLHFPVAVVCACCEYESWFLADFDVLKGRVLPLAQFSGNAETKCNAKEWINLHLPAGEKYKEVHDQPTFTASLNFDFLQQVSRSFRRLVHAVEEIIDVFYESKNTVTPLPKE